MKKMTILSLALVAILAASCSNSNNSQPVKERLSKYVTDPEKTKMLNSLEELDQDRIYLMNYTVDYQLDKVLAANANSLEAVYSLLSSTLYDVQPANQNPMKSDCGCSAFAATLEGSGDYLMGRNYDFCHWEVDHEEAATAIVLFTAPEGGKKSINFVDAYWMGFHKGFYNNDSIDISNLIFAPYIILDGMNEDGLAISVLHLDGQPTEQNKVGKPDIYTSIAMRAVLDKFSTVDEASEFLSSYNMHMATPAKGSLHFMLADANGSYAVAEWSFSDPENVDSTTVPTEYFKLEADSNRYVTNFYVDSRLNNCIFGGLSNHGRDRYNTLRDTLTFNSYKLTEQQAKNLLKAVSQDSDPSKPTSHTQWSNVYNLSQRTVKTAILQEYERWHEFTVTGKQ